MIKKLTPVLTLMLTAFSGTSFADEKIDLSTDLTLNVTIAQPVCSLSIPTGTDIKFNDFSAVEVVANTVPTRPLTIKFDNCQYVKKINVAFKKSDQSSFDSGDILIPNKEGDGMAKGIAVKLVRSNNTPINLGEKMEITLPTSATETEIPLTAKVISINGAGIGLTAGELKTSVGIEVSYD